MASSSFFQKPSASQMLALDTLAFLGELIQGLKQGDPRIDMARNYIAIIGSSLQVEPDSLVLKNGYAALLTKLEQALWGVEYATFQKKLHEMMEKNHCELLFDPKDINTKYQALLSVASPHDFVFKMMEYFNNAIKKYENEEKHNMEALSEVKSGLDRVNEVLPSFAKFNTEEENQIIRQGLIAFFQQIDEKMGSMDPDYSRELFEKLMLQQNITLLKTDMEVEQALINLEKLVSPPSESPSP